MKTPVILTIFAASACALGGLVACNTSNSQGESAACALETDSVAAIEARTRADFSLDRDELVKRLSEAYEGITEAEIDSFIELKYIEAMSFDGEERYHRKAVRNLGLMIAAHRDSAFRRGSTASEARIAYVDSILAFYRGTNPEGLAHAVTYRFSIDVPFDEAIAGDTLKVWMPVPLNTPECSRQWGVEILSTEPAEYILSDSRSVHNSIYFEAPAPEPGDTAHFEYVARFSTAGSYFPAEKISDSLKPYDTAGDIYTRYTKLPDGPHIVRLDTLAHKIVGSETNPYRQSELVFDYIIERYPWAGAREYSTIPCIPEYVTEQGHGDCGQVSLLYISLMRSLGVPARWESGWMLHPGELNLHDWAEVYFEGVGWVPVDVSFGRYTGASDPETRGFYSHGIDSHRLAANKGVGGAFYPPKRFVRSETVDFQVGEVETTKGNLYYPAWNYHFEIISQKAVK